MKAVYQDVQVANEACSRDQKSLNKKILSMLAENRELKVISRHISFVLRD